MRIAAPNTLRRPLTTLVEDKSGSVAMMFSISIFGVLMLIGAAFDYGRIIHARQKIGAAVDAATIAAAKRLKDTNANKADIEAFANVFFTENIKTSTSFAKILNFKVDIDNATNAVTTTVNSEVDTTFTRIAGIKTVAVPATSTVIFNSQDIEVGLQLDVTGSMSGIIKGSRRWTA